MSEGEIAMNPLTDSHQGSVIGFSGVREQPAPSLPESILEHILVFAGVSTLGACACSSKLLNKIATSNQVWVGHLKGIVSSYGGELEDLALHMKTWVEKLGYYNGDIRECYKDFGGYVVMNAMIIPRCLVYTATKNKQCIVCDRRLCNENQWCRCGIDTYRQAILDLMPSIRLFRVVPVCYPSEYQKFCCKYFFDVDGMYRGGNDEDLEWVIRQWEQNSKHMDEDLNYDEELSWVIQK